MYKFVSHVLCVSCPLCLVSSVSCPLCLMSCVSCPLCLISSVSRVLCVSCPLCLMSSVSRVLCVSCPLCLVSSVSRVLCVSCPLCLVSSVSHVLCVCLFQNKTCVQTLEGHAQNVTCVCFHPELPIILTGSEDGGPQTHKNEPPPIHRPLNAPRHPGPSSNRAPLCVSPSRHRASVALQHLPAGEHAQLRHGAGVVHLQPARLQQRGPGLRRRQHHHQGVPILPRP